jgi:deoxycytidine triphosphate deaminase
MINTLPKFKDYTIDVRLKQFRKVYKTGEVEFIDMKSEEGDRILMQINGVDEKLFMEIAGQIY